MEFPSPTPGRKVSPGVGDKKRLTVTTDLLATLERQMDELKALEFALLHALSLAEMERDIIKSTPPATSDEQLSPAAVGKESLPVTGEDSIAVLERMMHELHAICLEVKTLSSASQHDHSSDKTARSTK